MHESDHLGELRDAEGRELMAIRRRERRMAREARRLERELAALGDDEARAERLIEDEWHREHFGREPDAPPPWWRVPRGTHGRRRRA